MKSTLVNSICLKCSATIEAARSGGQCPQCGGGLVSEGAHIGPYRLIRLIASSPSARVHLAWHEKNEIPVALKVLLELSDREEKRFRRQIELITKLKHSHILPVLDYGRLVGDLFKMAYVATQYVEGFTLDTAPGTLVEKLSIGVDVARALDYAHRRKVVHRDVKPTNILVDKTGHGSLADFGLAKSVHDSDSQVTVTGSIVGTPHYMSPEQARGERVIGPASDIFSLGATLYHLATGHLPFENTGSTMQIIRRAATQPAPKPSTARPDIDPNLERIIVTAMRFEPGKRYAGADLLAQDLKAHLQGRRATKRRATRSRGPAKKPATTLILEREAEVPLERAERLLPLYEITDRALQEKELTQIGEGIEEAFRIHPGNYRALICRGRLELVLRKHRDAIRTFSEAIERHPDLSIAYSHRLRALIRLYQDIRGIPVILIGDAPVVQPWPAETDEERRLRGEIVSDLRRLERTHGFGNDPRRAYVEGLISLYEGRYVEAGRKLKAASAQVGYEPDLWIPLAMVTLLQKDFQGALEAIQKGNSIRRSPIGLRLEANLLALTSRSQMESNRDLPVLEAAISVAERAAALDPTDPRLVRTLISVRRALAIRRSHCGLATRKDIEELIEVADRMLRLQPDFIPTQQIKPVVLETCAAISSDPEEKRRYTHKAVSLSRANLKRDPTSLIVKLNLSDFLDDLADLEVDPDGNRQESLRLLDEVIESEPRHSVAHMTRSRVLDKLGRGPEAELALRRAIGLEPRLEADPHVQALLKKLEDD